MCPAYLQQAEGLISDESDVSSTGGGEEERKNKKKKSLNSVASQQENQEETKCSWSASCRPQISAPCSLPRKCLIFS